MNLLLFAACAPGLEPFVAQELSRLKMPAVRAVPGGVEFRASQRELYRANLHLHAADRVLVRFAHFTATTFADLRNKAGHLPWEGYMQPGQPVALRTTCHKSKLYHSDAVAERVAAAVADRLGRPSPRTAANAGDAPPVSPLILVRLDHDRCVISLDSSGDPLHRRGYRLATAKAPLRETLAAGILLASGWNKTSPLVDPFCGSGTIAIEAALLARNLAPGRARRFAFMDWPSYDANLWQSALEEAEAHVAHDVPPILASDRDAGAVTSARDNAERAGVLEDIVFSRRAVSAIEPPGEHGWVVTNPPYGVRVRGGKDMRNLYAQFGHVLRAKCAGWRVAMLTGQLPLQRQVGLRFERGIALSNGGLRVRLVQASVPALPQDVDASNGAGA